MNTDLPFLPYGKPSLSPEDRTAVATALENDTLTRGACVERFETEIASLLDVQFAVSFNSGSTALAAAYWAAEISPYDRVLTTPNSFVATCGPAIQNGAQCRFVDIDRSSGNLQFSLVEENLQFQSSRGRLFVVPVHFAGIAFDMRELQNKMRLNNAVVIEDAAHALGSLYPSGEKVGSCAYSDMTILSFHPVKTITTGEGGMVTTNDPALFHRLKLYRNNGIEKDLPEKPGPWYYEVRGLTGNFHLTEMQAALGLSQLKRLTQFVEKRRMLVRRYREKLASVPFIRLFDSAYDERSAYHLFVAQIDFSALGSSRTQFMQALNERGIGSQVHYIPLYRHPALKESMGDLSEYFPEMEGYYAEALSLPLYVDLTEEEQDRVVNQLVK